jgi:predicted RNA-binding protein with PUA-like domain
MSYWLIKSEPEAYSFDQLVHDKQTAWTGIRNYTARNNLRAMKTGDLALFYHSNVGKDVVGIAKVVREHYPDKTAEKGDWSAVDIAPVKPFAKPVTLAAMREHPKLANMVLFKLGRLSVVPVAAAEFRAILAAGKTKL